MVGCAVWLRVTGSRVRSAIGNWTERAGSWFTGLAALRSAGPIGPFPVLPPVSWMLIGPMVCPVGCRSLGRYGLSLGATCPEQKRSYGLRERGGRMAHGQDVEAGALQLASRVLVQALPVRLLLGPGR